MLRVGAILDGKYRIERYLSSGGFGNTYVAINEFGEQVAIKEFFLRGVNQREANNTTVSVSNTENRAQFDQQRAKFKKEAMRLRGLLSPHIVKVQAFFEQNGTSYYVMDYIDGESLAERLRRTGQPLTEAEVLDILNQVLEALDEVHNSQPPLYHLDLKPGNIMADRHGQVLLIDFGSSKQSDGHGGVTVTAATFTREYAPLELIEGRLDKIGPWTDFYALGATLYRLLTNQTPPLYSDIQDEPAAAFHWPATVSQPTRDLPQWMMTPNRTHRPQSVAEVRQWLQTDRRALTVIPSIPPNSQVETEETIISRNGDKVVKTQKALTFISPFKGRYVILSSIIALLSLVGEFFVLVVYALDLVNIPIDEFICYFDAILIIIDVFLILCLLFGLKPIEIATIRKAKILMVVLVGLHLFALITDGVKLYTGNYSFLSSSDDVETGLYGIAEFLIGVLFLIGLKGSIKSVSIIFLVEGLCLLCLCFNNMFMNDSWDSWVAVATLVLLIIIFGLWYIIMGWYLSAKREIQVNDTL